MGQRFQSVFILPSIYMNQDNPNNRNEKVLIFHNQWLYGYQALKINLNIMKRLKQAINKRSKMGQFAKLKEDFINHFLEKSLLNAINWAGLQELHNERYFNASGELIYTDENNQKGLSDLLIRQDNNNGFFICIIDNNLNMEYAFISGFEDEDIINQKTPKEYFNIFYSQEQFKELSKQELKVFEDLDKFKQIPKSNLMPIIKALNQNKPSWAKGYDEVLNEYEQKQEKEIII